MSDDLNMVLTRHFAATPAQVWAAWTDPEILPRWFGPVGFSCQTKEIDLRTGGVWRFDMIGPDGTVWINRHQITLYEPISRIEFLLDDDGHGVHEPKEVVITLSPEAGGTRLVQKMAFSSQADLARARAMGAETLGYTTLDKLAAILVSG